MAEPQPRPPGVVAAGADGQKPAPARFSLLRVVQSAGAVALPEQLPCCQLARQKAAVEAGQHGGGLSPLPLQQGLAGQLPLQIPAAGFVGPALQDTPPGHLPLQGKPGLHGGAGAQHGGQPLQGQQGRGARLLGEEGSGLSGFRAVGLPARHREKQALRLQLLLARSPQQCSREA